MVWPADAGPFDPAVAEAARATVFRAVVGEYGGSFSAEHGIGQLKRDELRRYKSALELDMMRQIKRAFDPHGLMNPGKLFDPAPVS
jgi:FAD/FMN-containing dehydrogenase